jgi:hypothetical protein
VQNDKPLSFDDPPEPDFIQDDDDMIGYKYYKSDKILGKLYRAIDEREVFGGVRQPGLLAYMEAVDEGQGSATSVLEGVWDYVQHRCQAIQWEHHLDRARGIRDEYASLTSYITCLPASIGVFTDIT